VTPSSDAVGHPSEPVDGLSLSEYVEVCRSLIRHGAGSTRGVEEVLAIHDLTQSGWARVSAMWTERIRRDPAVRSEFQRLYARPAPEPAAGNE
jgi:hypothetical protein